MALCIPSSITCQYVFGIWHKGYLCRTHGFHKVNKTVGAFVHMVAFTKGVAFYIELCTNHLFQSKNIGVANVPLIGTGMHRNTLCTEPFAVLCKTDYIWNITTTSIANGGYLIYIDTKFGHRCEDYYLHYC